MFILDSLVSIVMLNQNYVDVCDWFITVNLDTVETIVLIYHEG